MGLTDPAFAQEYQDDGFDAWAEKFVDANAQPESSQVETDSPTYNAAARCRRTLSNGDILAGGLPVIEFPHRLIIENGQNSVHAFVRLVGIENGVNELFFVSGNDRVELSDIPDGRYQVKFAVGGALAADCETVVRPRTTHRFPTIQSLVTTRTKDSIETAVLSFTLFEVQGGNVAPVDITVAEFNRD